MNDETPDTKQVDHSTEVEETVKNLKHWDDIFVTRPMKLAEVADLLERTEDERVMLQEQNEVYERAMSKIIACTAEDDYLEKEAVKETNQ